MKYFLIWMIIAVLGCSLSLLKSDKRVNPDHSRGYAGVKFLEWLLFPAWLSFGLLWVICLKAGPHVISFVQEAFDELFNG